MATGDRGAGVGPGGRRSAVRMLAGTAVALAALTAGCSSASDSPQIITNSDAQLSYTVGGDWKPAHVYLPFAEGGGNWSGVAQVGDYQCGANTVSRAMVGGAPFPLPTDQDTALTIAANSVLLSVVGVSPPEHLPAPTAVTVGGVAGRKLEVTVNPHRPGCDDVATTLDVLALPAATGRLTLFFLIADRSGGPSSPDLLASDQQDRVLDSVRVTG